MKKNMSESVKNLLEVDSKTEVRTESMEDMLSPKTVEKLQSEFEGEEVKGKNYTIKASAEDVELFEYLQKVNGGASPASLARKWAYEEALEYGWVEEIEPQPQEAKNYTIRATAEDVALYEKIIAVNGGASFATLFRKWARKEGVKRGKVKLW